MYQVAGCLYGSAPFNGVGSNQNLFTFTLLVTRFATKGAPGIATNGAGRTPQTGLLDREKPEKLARRRAEHGRAQRRPKLADCPTTLQRTRILGSSWCGCWKPSWKWGSEGWWRGYGWLRAQGLADSCLSTDHVLQRNRWSVLSHGVLMLSWCKKTRRSIPLWTPWTVATEGRTSVGPGQYCWVELWRSCLRWDHSLLSSYHDVLCEVKHPDAWGRAQHQFGVGMLGLTIEVL